ncbi:M24 family metallopeptidase [Chloroflexota bacterium]
MLNEELERARNELRIAGADWALLSSYENVTYVSHFEVPVEFGFYADLAYSPCLCLLGTGDSGSSLLIASYYQGRVTEPDAVDKVLLHDVIGALDSVPARENYLASLREALLSAGLRNGKAKLAIEERTLPAATHRFLTDEFPNLELVEAGPALRLARSIKTEREIGKLRFAAEANRAGQEEFLRQCEKAGRHDIEIWSAVTKSIQKKAKRRLDFFVEMIVGEGCAYHLDGPREGVSKPGEMALIDNSIRVDGYWSDTTNTSLIGGLEPTEKQKMYGKAAIEAFDAAVEALRPGRKSSDVWHAANDTFAKCGFELPHHAGHQIGTSINEWPRLLPSDETVIRPGMVFCVEPGCYEGHGGTVGARMEKQVIVREAGPEVFPDFEWGF